MLFLAVLFIDSKIEAVDKEEAVNPVNSIVLKEMVDILSNRFNTQIQVGSVFQLSEQERLDLTWQVVKRELHPIKAKLQALLSKTFE